MKNIPNLAKGEQILAALFVTLMMGYLILLNYHLPFLTMDELAFVGKMQGGFESRLAYGRPSHVIGYGINNIIDFATPDFVGLTKRLITMVVLFGSVVATLVHFDVSRPRSVMLAAFAIMAHQVDWQHNGLVAFFGGYNLFLGFFLFALILNERAHGWGSAYILSFTLIFLSFTSELFVGLAFIYVIAKAFQVKNASELYKGPIAIATFLYILLFLILRAVYEDPIPNGGVDSITYATGSLSSYPPGDIIAGSLISLINAAPYFSHLKLSQNTTIWFASVLAGGLLVFCVRVFFLNWKSGLPNIDGIRNVRSAAFLITLCALALSPAVLMALQPMKLEWILSGSSTRYAFSLYEWLALVMIFAIFIKHLPAVQAISVSVGLVIASIGILIYSVSNNFIFADSYAESMDRWRNIDNAIKNSKEAVVKMPIEWLQHPNTITFQASAQGHRLDNIVKLIANNFYGKEVLFCYDLNDFDITTGKAAGIVDLHGFADAEQGARWTNASVSEIRFLRKLDKGEIVELSLENAFSFNSEMPVKYTIGSAFAKSIFAQNKQVSILLNESLENPTLFIHIPKAISPKELGQGEDSRSLGVMVKRIRIGKYQNKHTFFESMEKCI